ncbi:rCG59185 [Rattus norvegicus]|uniref:RCG59185 n=1 Tax=Rattus norvegicus TaxID=10116 RepID=A6KIV3_RAT|nr:rCG59185 [Rattus norvegicus]
MSLLSLKPTTELSGSDFLKNTLSLLLFHSLYESSKPKKVTTTSALGPRRL